MQSANGGAHSGNGYRNRKETRVQILDEVVCIPLCAKTLRKNMNSTILTPAMGK